MIEFEMTWVSENGRVCHDTGWASTEQIKEWNTVIARCVAEGDQITEIKVPTQGDSDWSDGSVRAFLVKEILPKVRRPADW